MLTSPVILLCPFTMCRLVLQVLFWAEIYHQAKSLPSFILRPLFLAINGAVYAAQIGLWIYMGLAPKDR